MSPKKQGVFGLGLDKEEKASGKKLLSWRELFFEPAKLRIFAKYCPLVAAILAPLATLLDIPALTQHWYSRYGDPQPDPTVSLALSGLGLGVNILANALLLVRFMSRESFWIRQSTRLSLLFWVVKTVVAAVNLIIFGILTRNGNGYTYAEGFWCAVVSIIDSGIISIALLFHYFLAFGRENHDTNEVRLEGRKFMLSVTWFLVILAFQSLAFCKIEHWAYSDAIYFSIQTALTIGYGDFTPTTAAGKVLVFPFSVLTISQLGNEIALIIAFISTRSDERRSKWRKRYENAMHREANALRPTASLIEEMALIHQINNREELMTQLYDLWWSALSLLIFWMIGAVMFSQIEGWSFGNAVYAVMILSITIGFGDFTPKTPAGKVVFVVYALAAVPIVTSFAVQSITGLLGTYQNRGGNRERFKRERTKDPDAFMPHADFILRAHESYADVRKRLLGDDAAIPQLSGGGDPNHQEGDEDGSDATAVQDGEAPKATQDGEASTPDQDGAASTAVQDGETSTTMADGAEEGSDPTADQDGEAPTAVQDEEASSAIQDEDTSTAVLEGKRKSTEDGTDRSIREAKEREEEEEEDDLNESERVLRNDYRRVQGVLKQRKPAGDDMDEEEAKKDTEEHKVEIDLLKQLMDRTVRLEAEARQMLLDSMDKGIARTLLLADRNVQVRDVRALRGDDANMLAIWRGEEQKTARDQKNREAAHQAEDVDMLNRVRRYRNTFAEILVIGSILQKLEGEELNRFERWRDEGQTREAEERQGDGDGEALEDVAQETWEGITGRMFRHHAKRIRKTELSSLEKGLTKWGEPHEVKERGTQQAEGH
ncbi:hypothetical protein BCR39DRAFT_535524 [Naematelia encephala]|uniref:Potassium channel domain-containing protein n=1 Tax=Naematelia encephala TaxID=71784 RepID=A0A1Y2B0G6_9TREE|nr:hypothetical protein BCR39DRAFT_535524 [Naematelia encephala]